MKKLIFLIPLLVSLFAPAQQRQPRQPSTSNTLVDQHVHVELAFRTPVFADTTAANAVTSLDSCGKLIYTYDADAHWSRACFPVRHWVRVGSTTSLTGSQSIFIAGDGSPGAPYTPTLIISQQSGNAVTVNPDGVFVQAQIPNGLIEGGFVIHLTGLTYLVTPARYAINGVIYTSPATEITLQNADLNDPRFDAFVVTTSSTAEDITGTPDPTNPQNPSFNPLTQLPLTFVQVTANQTEPTVCRDSIYYPNNGNTWTALASAPTRINITSTTDPYSVTQAIDFTAAQNNDFLRMEKGSTISISTYAVMALRIKSKAQWASTSRISIQFYSNATPLGVPVIIGDFTPYGFNSSNTATYQTPVIPLANFGSGLGTANAIVLTVLNTGANTIGFRLDDWELLGCDGAPPTTGSFWNTTGNQEGRPLIGGTLDNQIIQFKANNLNHTQLKTDGTTWMQGTNPGISFFLGTFAASDYFIRRNANTLTLNVASAAIIDHTIQGTSMYNISAANGHLFNSSAGTFQMQMNASGQLLVGTNSQTASNLVAFNSTTRAIRLTNQTDAQMNAIANDAGMITFNTTASLPYYNNGSAWLPIGTSVTANNGLIMSTATNVQLFGTLGSPATLLDDRYLTAGGFIMSITGSDAGTTNGVFNVTNTAATGNAIYATANSTSNAAISGQSSTSVGVSGSGNVGVLGSATSGTAVWAIATSGVPLLANTTTGLYSIRGVSNPSSTNTVIGGLVIERSTSGSAAAGIGVSIDFKNEVDNLTTQTSNQLISKFTSVSAGAQHSQFQIVGMNAGSSNTIATFDGAGSVGIGSTTPASTATRLYVRDIASASGDIVVIDGATSGYSLEVTNTGGTGINSIGASNGAGVRGVSDGASGTGIIAQGGFQGLQTSVSAANGTALSIPLNVINNVNPAGSSVIMAMYQLAQNNGTDNNQMHFRYNFINDNNQGFIGHEIFVTSTDVSDNVEDAMVEWRLIDNGSPDYVLRMESDGTLHLLGAPYVGLGAGYIAVSNTGELSWSAGAGGSGDVVKVGTPVNDQLGVWTGNGTIEGDANLTFAGSTLTVGLAGTALGSLVLAGNTAQTITLRPLATAGNYTLTFPADDGTAGQFLSTDGTGGLTWSTPGGGGTLVNFAFTDGSGFDGTVTSPASSPVLSLVITASGMLKGSAGAIVAAVSGTDYLPITGGTSVTTLGTIGTGTWQGTAVGATFGGTGQTSWTAGQMLVATGVNTLGKLSPGTNGQVLQIVAGVPAWATGGTVSTVDGGTTGLTFTNPTTTPTMTGTLGFANGGTSATSRQAAINALAGAVTNGQVLRGNGTNIVMGQVNAATDITGTLQLANGGLGTNTITSGQIFIGAAGNTIIKGTILGTANQINSSFNGTNYVISHAFNPTEQVLTSGAVITWNLLNGGNALLTLTNTGATLASPSNVVAGYTYTLRIIQGSGGGRTITTWTNVHWTGGTPPVLQTAVGKMDVIRLYAVTSTYFVGTIIPDVQ